MIQICLYETFALRNKFGFDEGRTASDVTFRKYENPEVVIV